MARPKKTLEETDALIDEALNEVKVSNEIAELHLNHNLGRQDLDEAFKKVEDKINEIIRKK